MQSKYSETDLSRAVLTLENIAEAIERLMEWNISICSCESYYESQNGMQILTANCTLIVAIGEGINRVNKILPDFLSEHFPAIPWRAIVGMHNHIAHGYFELDAEIVYTAVKKRYAAVA